ncbi:hypothetical protein C8F01DRAFT_640878 [Mycena amicta]|nr:hypothetical protein C8F01DRAFT_640878 [Mycena amicta]
MPRTGRMLPPLSAILHGNRFKAAHKTHTEHTGLNARIDELTLMLNKMSTRNPQRPAALPPPIVPATPAPLAVAPHVPAAAPLAPAAPAADNRAPLTEAEKVSLRDRVRVAIANQAPNTPAGRTAYAQQIQAWDAQHAGRNVRMETSGFPLTPGTAAPCTSECWKCGLVSNPPHSARDCPNPPVPALERRFRSLAARALGARANIAVAPVNAVHYADWSEVPLPAQEDFPAGQTA